MQRHIPRKVAVSLISSVSSALEEQDAFGVLAEDNDDNIPFCGTSDPVYVGSFGIVLSSLWIIVHTHKQILRTESV